jgi:hypothetical protein
MNILFKICGVIYLINFVLYLFNYYHPHEFSIAINMLIIGIFCIFAKYSKPSKES